MIFDRTLILSVFIVASCGLAYELIAGALTSYLLGDSVLQFSSIIGCYLFAMGIGSHLSKYVKDEDALSRFIDIELLVGLLGGVSATLLFLVFAWLSAPFRTALYALVFVIGVLVGMEIPLVMRVLNGRRAEFRELISRVLTFDYLGALAVSLLFPLLLAPKLGLSRTGFLFGMLNAGVALWTSFIFRDEVRQTGKRVFTSSIVLGLLAMGFLTTDRRTDWAETGLFLYINGNLQFSSRDEHRYHEALVHPALQSMAAARSVLVLGGGDGMAVREILKHPNIEHVTLVDLDPAMTNLFSQSEPLLALNHGSLKDRRVSVVNEDAGRWLESHTEVFDVIIADFPDPSNFGLGKLYSVPMYRLMAKHLSENGYLAVQSTSPYFAPRSFWCIDATLREAGFRTWPYHAYVPSFGEWGFVIASKRANFSPPQHYSIPTRFLDEESTRLMFKFPPDMKPLAVEPNRLNSQSLVHYFEEDWRQVLR